MKINDMMAPPPVRLPAADLPDNISAETALKFPAEPAVWATLAEEHLANEDNSAEHLAHTYALARTGYHRGLDRLRGNGWKGWGPVPWSHEPNRGVLRAIAALARAAQAIGEADEYDRCRQMLSDADPECVATLLDKPAARYPEDSPAISDTPSAADPGLE